MEKAYLIVGLGVSGNSAKNVLESRGERVLTADDNKPADYRIDEISNESFNYADIQAVITSPGFKPTTGFILKATQAGVPVISDVELAWKLHNENELTRSQVWIGITGTNGKTTTTEMTNSIMQAAGRHSQAVGNIGNPISQAGIDTALDTLTVELSSFQMHYTNSLELDCAAITNLADDHLDWHGGFDNYAADKAKVYNRAKKAVVYNADDERVTRLAMKAKEKVESEEAGEAEEVNKPVFIGFTLRNPAVGEIGVDNGWIVNRSELPTLQERLAPITSFTHLTEPDGTIYPHLLADALCALSLSLGAGIDTHVAISALQEFAPSGHRIETVATWHTSNGSVRFVDDSKATNSHAAAASLSSFADKSVVWIAGGLAKGSEFSDLIKTQKSKIRAAVIIGVDQQPMIDALKDYAPEIPVVLIDPETAETKPIMKQAVEACARLAQAGNVVLMAPACASMDQFVSYADRGNQFAQYAQEWVNTHVE
ncbi:UDP-N-acetylmuramoyl-L-alanine--D-glutamate ligase [Alloscardovia theropitheci]|uniref:UDP-N-acetylmuramoylalanine--D-glutamate ligase n=1 Tax=Alloscardovia theropitheci TaxID=2496842 RepID=A0A4R0QV30_9BIFI|nr:UDP-N-acetylmuramoyl-L-alanine--D-glutamate ligase [Alloscardovia theropitheci]TCD53967.1 UDP-N-acetylmuramoyl-L-alanine--D-glutamate ligase [Alloscardovia theropitheci]